MQADIGRGYVILEEIQDAHLPDWHFLAVTLENSTSSGSSSSGLFSSLVASSSAAASAGSGGGGFFRLSSLLSSIYVRPI